MIIKLINNFTRTHAYKRNSTIYHRNCWKKIKKYKKLKIKNKKEIEIEIVNGDDDDKGHFARWLMYGFSVDEYEYHQIIELLYGSSDKEKVNWLIYKNVLRRKINEYFDNEEF